MSSTKTYKVGVLLNSLTCTTYLNRTIKELSSCNDIELYLLMEQRKDESICDSIKKSELSSLPNIKRTIENLLFRLWVNFEFKTIGFLYPRFKKHLSRVNIESHAFQDTLTITPIFSPSTLCRHYNEKDIENIKSLNLDLIIRGTQRGVLKGKILESSKHGIISFHHGDRAWVRGGPPAFWEAYKRRPSTGFSIEILAGARPRGKVLFRGAVPTCPIYSLNFWTLYKESNPFLSKVVIEYLRGTITFQDNARTPFSEPIFESPGLASLFRYVCGLVGSTSIDLLRRKLLRRQCRWSIGYTSSSWQEAELCKGVVIENPRKRFFADPFVTYFKGDNYIFVEDYDYQTKKGSISCIKISKNNNFEIIKDVIKEDYHLSFPFLVQEQDKLYIIPETHQSDSIRLYECIEFPYEWRLKKELVTGVSAADTMVFKWGKQWIMLTNKNEFRTSGDHSCQLYAYRAKSLLSDNWIPLLDSGLPIIFDPLIARNGGLLTDNTANIYRVRQAQVAQRYGAKFSIAKIKKIEANCYEEEFVCEVNPHFLPRLVGSHHMHSNGLITVYDFAAWQTIG